MADQVNVDELLKDDGPVNPYTTSGTLPWQDSDYDRYDQYQAEHGGSGGAITGTIERLPTVATGGGLGAAASAGAAAAGGAAAVGSDNWLSSAGNALSSGLHGVGSWLGL